MSEAGDTFTSGADMDWPGSPLGPGCPGIPAPPCKENRQIFKHKLQCTLDEKKCLSYEARLVLETRRNLLAPGTFLNYIL